VGYKSLKLLILDYLVATSSFRSELMPRHFSVMNVSRLLYRFPHEYK
jgi:hypothetical protein